MSKDYYKILGITEFETAENIKLAYRKLARKYHPDIAGNTQEVMLKFKEINEAYEILGNKIKKEEYDRARRFYNYAKNNTETKYNQELNKKQNTKDERKENFNFNWADFINKKNLKNNYKKNEKKSPRNGENIYTEIEINPFEAINGACKTINILQTNICPKCNGRRFINGNICKHCNGKGEDIKHKKFTVKIPAGIKNKSKIRLAGEGMLGENGGKNGDLYITVNISQNKEYKIEGINVLKTISLLPHEAVLGTSLALNTFYTNTIIKLAPNTQNGQKIRLAGCGLVQNNKIGDMILTVEIKIPTNITAEEIDLYRKLEQISSKK